MNNKETTFETAEKGDKVYCMLFSNNSNEKTNACILDMGDVTSIAKRLRLVGDDTGEILYADIKGLHYRNGGQVVFWEKPDFVIPERTIRFVKKKMYMCYYSGDTNFHTIVNSKQEAQRIISVNRSYDKMVEIKL